MAAERQFLPTGIIVFLLFEQNWIELFPEIFSK